MSRNTIEFKKSGAPASPWSTPARGAYQDLLIKPEFAARRYKFPVGTTWIRVVPALLDSNQGWMLGIHSFEYPSQRHAHPKTIQPGAESVFDKAYQWFKHNQPGKLYTKSNKEGYRLLADPVCLLWFLVEENGKTVARLLLASGYDGSRGGVPGLGHRILELAQQVDEDGNLVSDPANPETGVQISVEKKQSPGARYPSYSLRPGRVPAPMDAMLAKMDPEEIDAIKPLEEVVHIPSEEEEWALLENVIDPETIREIRASLG